MIQFDTPPLFQPCAQKKISTPHLAPPPPPPPQPSNHPPPKEKFRPPHLLLDNSNTDKELEVCSLVIGRPTIVRHFKLLRTYTYMYTCCQLSTLVVKLFCGALSQCQLIVD